MTARYSKGPRLFLSDVRFSFPPGAARILNLPAEESHYVRDVLRLSIGDPLEIGHTSNKASENSITSATVYSLADTVTVELHGPIEAPAIPARAITLVCALCKGDKNEQIIDWATELGCTAFHFWQASRSVVRIRSSEELAKKTARFQKVALAAAQQSKQSAVPMVAVHKDLGAVVDELSSDRSSQRLICSLEPEAAPIHVALEESPIAAPVIITVGPEGDFSPEETTQLVSLEGFRPVSLGSSVLRSELAVVTAIVAIRRDEQATFSRQSL
jgi:16S rRNA (uracil1498-N3)-methyltransferase